MAYRPNSLVYTLVARGPPAPMVPLAEYCVNDGGDFEFKAYEYLNQISSSNHSMSIKFDDLTFNYLVRDGFTYCVVTDQENEMDFLDYLHRVRKKFVEIYGEKAASAPAYGLNNGFGLIIKDYMLNYEDPDRRLARERQRKEETVRRWREMAALRNVEMNQMNSIERQTLKENALSKRCKRLISKTICGRF